MGIGVNGHPTLSELQKLLLADEPAAFEVENAEARSSLLLVGDHAGARVPRRLAQLGVAPEIFDLHVAVDLGVAALVRALSHRFNATAVQANYSRLVIDANRQPGSPASIVPVSDGYSIVGNKRIDSAARRQRENELFWPYHREIESRLAIIRENGYVPVVFAVHSFTPQMDGQGRPWQAGVLWKHDARVATPLIAALRARGLTVGDNEPYSGHHPDGFTIEHHAEPHGLVHALVEVRQDQLADNAGVQRWCERLYGALAPILATVGTQLELDEQPQP